MTRDPHPAELVYWVGGPEGLYYVVAVWDDFVELSHLYWSTIAHAPKGELVVHDFTQTRKEIFMMLWIELGRKWVRDNLDKIDIDNFDGEDAAVKLDEEKGLCGRAIKGIHRGMNFELEFQRADRDSEANRHV